MTKLTLAAALALALSTGTSPAASIASLAGAFAPHAVTRPGHRPRNARAAHCAKKADSVGVEGRAREIYLRKCGAA